MISPDDQVEKVPASRLAFLRFSRCALAPTERRIDHWSLGPDRTILQIPCVFPRLTLYVAGPSVRQ